jgi:hypothetical protein
LYHKPTAWFVPFALYSERKGAVAMSKPVQMTLRLSPEWWSLMQQVMGKTTYKSVNEFIRTCIRAYLDETGDIIGSRKHFQNRLAERMDRLEAMLLWNTLQSQVLTARGMFTSQSWQIFACNC